MKVCLKGLQCRSEHVSIADASRKACGEGLLQAGREAGWPGLGLPWPPGGRPPGLGPAGHPSPGLSLVHGLTGLTGPLLAPGGAWRRWGRRGGSGGGVEWSGAAAAPPRVGPRQVAGSPRRSQGQAQPDQGPPSDTTSDPASDPGSTS